MTCSGSIVLPVLWKPMPATSWDSHTSSLKKPSRSSTTIIISEYPSAQGWKRPRCSMHVWESFFSSARWEQYWRGKNYLITYEAQMYDLHWCARHTLTAIKRKHYVWRRVCRAHHDKLIFMGSQKKFLKYIYFLSPLVDRSL